MKTVKEIIEESIRTGASATTLAELEIEYIWDQIATDSFFIFKKFGFV